MASWSFDSPHFKTTSTMWLRPTRPLPDSLHLLHNDSTLEIKPRRIPGESWHKIPACDSYRKACKNPVSCFDETRLKLTFCNSLTTAWQIDNSFVITFILTKRIDANYHKWMNINHCGHKIEYWGGCKQWIKLILF